METGSALFANIGTRPGLQESLRRDVGRHPWWELADDSYSRLWHSPQYLKDIGKITAATLVLVGENDCGAVKQCASILERLIPCCRRCDLHGLGHLCALEDPELVRPLIEQHWRRNVNSAVTERVVYNYAAEN
jgi:pimeloyl-ACP methyl ester carboxylesterase